jgi:hypothetical protein
MMKVRANPLTIHACLKKHTDMYYAGTFKVPGFAQLLEVDETEWEKKELATIQEENAKALQQFGKLETVELLDGRPVVTEAVKKWCSQCTLGERVQALVKLHENEWGHVEERTVTTGSSSSQTRTSR